MLTQPAVGALIGINSAQVAGWEISQAFSPDHQAREATHAIIGTIQIVERSREAA
jgi:hypothetical protein